MKAEFLYRDAANYKKWFTVELPEGFRPLKEEDEVEMQEVGVVPESVWESFIGGTDTELDHTTLTFLRYVPEGEDIVGITTTYYLTQAENTVENLGLTVIEED